MSSNSISHFGGRLTLSASRLHFPEVPAALINFRRESGYLFPILGERMTPWDWLGLWRTLVSRVWDLVVWDTHSDPASASQRLLLAIRRVERGCRLSPDCAVAGNRRTRRHLIQTDRLGTTFPRGPRLNSPPPPRHRIVGPWASREGGKCKVSDLSLGGSD